VSGELFSHLCLTYTAGLNVLAIIYILFCPEWEITELSFAQHTFFISVLSLTEFYVLLTVHLGVILVNNQLDAQFFFLMCLLQFCTCFEQHRAHPQENDLYQYNIWYTSLYLGDRLVCKSGSSCLTCILDGQSDAYQILYWCN
jgi:hypothetical protein